MNKDSFLRQFQLGQLPAIESPLEDLSGFRPSAVLVPIVERPQGLQLLLTQRALHLRHHPGQISFPGGKYEDDDITLTKTAIRETMEEIGIAAHQIELVGQLSRYRTVSMFEITPIVAFVDPGYQTRLNRGEVDHAFEVPLREVLDHPSHFSIAIQRGNQQYDVFFKPCSGKPIWGATAAILEQLRMLLADRQPEVEH